MDEPEKKPLEDVLDTATEEPASDTVRAGDLLDYFGDRSFGPILVILGVIAVSPIGAVPGIPAAIGVIIVLIAGQLVLGRTHVWLPPPLERLGFQKDKLVSFRDTAQPWLRRVDMLISERLTWATGELARRSAAVLCIILAGLMIPLEIIPFAVALPAAAIILFGLALTARDGVLMLLAAVLTAVSAYLAASTLL